MSYWRKAMTNLDCIFKKQRHHFTNKGLYSQNFGFSNCHVQMQELDHKESWALKNWCCQIVVLEKTLESPLDYKEIKKVSPKGDQPWIFIGKTVAEALGHYTPARGAVGGTYDVGVPCGKTIMPQVNCGAGLGRDHTWCSSSAVCLCAHQITSRGYNDINQKQ